MAVKCLNCGNRLRDPGGSLVGKHCSICKSTQIVREDTGSLPPSGGALGAAVVGGIVGGLALGAGGALVGALIAAVLTDTRKRA